MPAVAAHEHVLTEYALAALAEAPGVRIIGPTTATGRGGAVSFTVDGLHPHDVGQVLDDEGIAVRVGHHCAWPTCRRFDVPATTRASFALYNQPFEVDLLVVGIRRAQTLLRGRPDGRRSTRRSSSTTTATRSAAGCASRSRREVHHVNPTCGDEITLRVHLEGAGESATVADISYDEPGLLDLAGQRQRHARAAGRAHGGRGDGHAGGVPRAHEVGHGRLHRARRGCPRRRPRVQRGGEVPGTGEVRIVVLDGLEGRRHPGPDPRR